MKIVYFSYIYDINGISLAAKIKAQELFSELNSLGHEVKIYWLNRQPSNDLSIKEQTRNFIKNRLKNFLHEPNQILTNVKYYFKEAGIIEREKPDVIITRLDVYKVASCLLARKKKIPFVLELDSPVVYEFLTFQPEYKSTRGILESLEMFNLQNATQAFTVSKEIKEYYLNRGISPQKIEVITNGVNVNKFHPQINCQEIIEKYNLQNNIVIGFVGTFHYWHGVDNLKFLIKKVLNNHKNVKFFLVGSGGPLKKEIQQFIREGNLDNQVIFTGYVAYDKIPLYIAAMDIVLAPYPGLDFFYYSPMKVYEYMACGKPVIATNIGQLSELIEDGFTGLLCKQNCIEDLYDKINRLITNDKLRIKIGLAAR
ncbi:MAG: glycosyltransferase family 1 protein, partial [Calditrichaeota bacterium]